MDFAKSVDDGLRLSKRLYFGQDRSVLPPRIPQSMDKNFSYLPTAVMVYAVIPDPRVVDNPDVPSYQPHVHGRCDPPALIPLQMNGVAMEVDCWLDTAVVTVVGEWRVHCVMGSRQCDCRIAVPMGDQGSILGFEVEIARKSYCTQLVSMDEKINVEKVAAAKAEAGGFLKPHIFTLTIPQVDGGFNIKIKVSWSQKLLYGDGMFTLNIPFNFPEYVIPAGKKISKKEKIQLNVNPGPGTEILLRTTSHPLKEIKRQVGKLGFLYDSEVVAWSNRDFSFTYSVSSHISGGVLLQSPSVLDSDQREMFCFYLYPGTRQSNKVFKKEVVFIVDVSGSMRGKALEDTKSALSAALSKLDPGDLFNVIAFNDEICKYSTSLELATKEAIENVTKWIDVKFIAGGGTNILLPLNQAIHMLSKTGSSIPIIFLITDGTVEDERNVCQMMESHLSLQGPISPRICTFGIGSFCNHYFLRMLALIGRGHYDAAYDADSIEVRMGRLFSRAFSTTLANIAVDGLEALDDLEVYPSRIPDLLLENPLIVSGRYHGVFPKTLKGRGILADMSNFTIDLKVHVTKDIPLDKVLAKQHIELCTAQAWLSENKELEEKIAKMSVQNSVVSEFTRMIMHATEGGMKTIGSSVVKEGPSGTDIAKTSDTKNHKIIQIQNLGLGFGNLIATLENTVPGTTEPKLPEAAEIFVKAASNCCGKIADCCCCMCCIQICSKMNDRCAIALTQLCGALACLGCFFCCELCCGRG